MEHTSTPLTTVTCSSCHTQIDAQWFFCAQCGRKLREKVITVSLGKQLVLYVFSVFFAPFGLIWATRYLRNPNRSTKVVGLIIILLTIVSIASMLIGFSLVMDRYARMLNGLGNGKYAF